MSKKNKKNADTEKKAQITPEKNNNTWLKILIISNNQTLQQG